MKLTKAKLINATQDKIKNLGYMVFTDSISIANCLFVKRIKNEYFLSLGLEISRYYDSRFSASKNLAPNERSLSVRCSLEFTNESFLNVVLSF